MSFKAKEPTGTVVYNPACAWCSGSGMIRVPDYNTISEYGYYDRIMAGDVPHHTVRMCYCHECYPEPPIRKGEIRYPNLLDHIDAVKSRGIPGEMEVLIAVLRYGFAMRDRKHIAEEMINTITK
jgi:hypothetical protein